MTTLSEEERESIIQEAIERVLLHIPDVMGNLVANHKAMLEINKKFYDDHKEFKDHKQAVMSVVEMMEAKYPHIGHEKILEKSVPEIKKRIEQTKNMDVSTIAPSPDRTFETIPPASIDKSHGEL